MNEAVEEIRNKVQEAFNTAGQTFTRQDKGHDQYEECCTFWGLIDNPNFPNVSKITPANNWI